MRLFQCKLSWHIFKATSIPTTLFNFSVPPQRLLIRDKDGKELSSTAGPYNEGDSLRLACQAKGGKKMRIFCGLLLLQHETKPLCIVAVWCRLTFVTKSCLKCRLPAKSRTERCSCAGKVIPVLLFACCVGFSEKPSG